MEDLSMKTQSRRRFLVGAGSFAASGLLLRGQDVVSANDRLRIGLIGCGGRMKSLQKQFGGMKDVEIVAISDPDTAHMDQFKGMLKGKADQYVDYKKLLERKDIDAVVIASPNHWHALHTIHACQAGKDVYVEKPVSHDLWSGRQMSNAAKRYGRIVQAGTQNRSDTGLIKAFDLIQSGGLGKIKEVFGTCYRNRSSIGKIDKPLTPPSTVDYDLWLGPALDKPIYRPNLHYDWHWDYNTGNGDVGNQAPHEFDLMQWVLGDPESPTEVSSFGGRFGWDDGGNTANMQGVSFVANGVPCTFEVNDMRLTPKRNVASVYKGIRVGVIVTCENGEFRGGRGGGYVVGPDGKTKIHKFPGDAGGSHARNFVDAVKSRKTEDLRAPVEKSHKTSVIHHLANISLLSGEQVALKDLPSSISDDANMQGIVERQAKQLKDWSIDFDKTMASVGPVVKFDPKSEMVAGPDKAVAIGKPEFRKGYEVPEIKLG